MKINPAQAAHYLWGGNCDGWHLFRSKELHIILEQMPPGTAEKLHYHLKATQFFYILEGEAAFEADDDFVTISAGEGFSVLPGTKHRILNKSAKPLKFLLVSNPPAQADRYDC